MARRAQPSRSALSERMHRPAAVAAVAAAFAFGVLAVRYQGRTQPGWVDERLTAVIRDFAAPSREFYLFLHLANPLPVVLAATALALVAWTRGRRGLALLAIVGPGLTGVCTIILKPLVDRSFVGFPAFPSGHAGAATALGLVFALLVVSILQLGPVAGGALLVAGATLAGGPMAVGLVVQQWHYPTDTLGGFCAAVGIVLGSALVIERIPPFTAAGTAPRAADSTGTL